MNKKNISLLLFLLILIVIFMFSRKKESVEQRINFFKINSENIHALKIFNQQDTVRIEINNDKWNLTYPLMAPIKEQQINRFFNDFIKVETSSIPISESVDRQTFYNVTDSTATVVEMYGRNNNLLQKVFCGRSQNFNYSYLRADGSRKIYQTVNLLQAINPAINTWREDKILNIVENDILTISVLNNKDSFELSQSELFWNITYADSSKTLELSNRELNTFKNALVNLRTNNFIDNDYDTYKDNFAKSDKEIIINLSVGQTVQLKFIELNENEYLLMRNNEQNTLYKLTKHQYNQLFISPIKLLN